MSVLQKDAAGDAVTAANQGFHRLSENNIKRDITQEVGIKEGYKV